MKVIFLDIDGVLNNTASLVEAVHLLPEKAILLQRLITATDAKIVISSTWRVGRTPAQIQEYLYFIGCWNATVVDFTPALPGVRGHEIQTWLDSGVTNVESYVIIDDDDDMLESQKDNFILTDIRCGFTSRDLAKAIEILNG